MKFPKQKNPESSVVYHLNEPHFQFKKNFVNNKLGDNIRGHMCDNLPLNPQY